MDNQSPSTKFVVPAADEAFHFLRDCRALYLKQIGQLLQEAERVPAAAVHTFQQIVGDYYDEMCSSNRRSGFDMADGLTASRISLVHESDLELDIRLGEFSSRLMESTSSALWRVYLRFVTLLRRPEMTTGENPVGPKGIALGLMEFCRELGEDHEQQLARVDRLEDYFSRHLTVLYTMLDEFLDQRHVNMAQAAIITAPDTGTPGPGNTATAAPATANAAVALQQRFLGSTGGTAGGETAGGAAGNLLNQAMLASLLTRLDELEKSGRLAARPSVLFAANADGPALENLIPGLFEGNAGEEGVTSLRTLDSGELGLSKGAPEAAAIDTLALIFETIFASTALPEAIKNVLASLQIPLLKVAMLDAGFFANPQHPGRQLLDKIARAGLGLTAETPVSHPLCQQLHTIATRVRAEFSNDIKLLEPFIKELDHLIAERDSATARTAETYLPLLQQLERRAQAERRARQVIEQKLLEGAPAEIAVFLRRHWQKLLQAVWLEGGEQGTDWLEYSALISELLWSVRPKNDMEERKQLAKVLQPMVQRLNAGMARIAVPEAEQAAFLDSCFALQTAAMRGTAAPEDNRASEPMAGDSSKPASSEFESAGLRLRVLDQLRQPAGNRLRPAPVRPGHWLRLSFDGKTPVTGLLCPGDSGSALQLIANPDWDHALAIHPDILEEMMAARTARICDTDSLFEAAAEKALLRSAKA